MVSFGGEFWEQLERRKLCLVEAGTWEACGSMGGVRIDGIRWTSMRRRPRFARSAGASYLGRRQQRLLVHRHIQG